MKHRTDDDLNPDCPAQHGLCKAVLTYTEELQDQALALEKFARCGQQALRRIIGKRVQKLVKQLTHLVKALEVPKK
jgi:hypothetical protein